MTDQARSNITAIRPYDVETRTRCFVLFATFAARNCAKTARLYANEVAGLGLPAPDVRTIQLWAAEDDWHGQADDWWQNSKGRTPQELSILTQANTMLGALALHDILTGLDARPVEERVITLKAIEVAMKTRERLPELARIEAPTKETDTKDMTREEAEAHAQALVARGTKGRTA